jgi:hypothetical protein
MREQKSPWPRRLMLVTGVVIGAATMHGTAVFAGDSKEKSSDDSSWSDDGNDDDHDSTVLSFATVGDSRQDPTSPDATTLPLSGQDAYWLQNSKAWSRIMSSVQKQHAKLLVFNGDMIMGYGNTVLPTSSQNTSIAGILGSDLVRTYREYAFWRGMIAPLMEAGTYVVPVPGNHEVQYKAGGKKANADNENAWRANMGDLILDTNRFNALFGETPANAVTGDTRVAGDNITTDQSKLTYSFDFHGSHFAIVNTDPTNNDAHAPALWLAQDLAAAKARGNTHFFVFGHKPAFTYYYGKAPTSPLPTAASGLDNDTTARNAFWAVIEQYGATYFCGHEHIYNFSQPTAATGGSAWQILVGSGGSPFEAKPTDTTINVTDRYYAWAKVDVRKSGKVKITGYGFNDQFGSTHTLQSIQLSH